jgi:hypothetical protein
MGDETMTKHTVVHLVNAERVVPRDRETLATKPIAGCLLAILEEVIEVGDQVLTRFLNRTESPSDVDDAISRAAREIAESPVSIEVMRVTEDCRLFFLLGFDEDDEAAGVDDTVAARILDLAATRTFLESATREEKDLESLAALRGGAIIGVPREDLLCAFFVDGGDLVTGVTNVALNVRENFDADDPASLSPHLYWVGDEGIDELTFTLDDQGQIDEMQLPEALAARWEAEDR